MRLGSPPSRRPLWVRARAFAGAWAFILSAAVVVSGVACGDAAIRGELDSEPPPGGDGDGSRDGRAYAFARVGQRCVAGGVETWLVLSKTRQDCSAYAEAVSAGAPGTLSVRIPADAERAKKTLSARTCGDGEPCRQREVELTFDGFEMGGEARGRWAWPEGEEESFTASWCEAPDVVSAGEELIRDLSIQDVTLNQGVEVTIAREGAAVTRLSAPIVAGRPGLLRVFVRPSAAWQARTVFARLEIEGRAEPFSAQGMIGGPSTPGDLASTLNFDLPAEALSSGLRYSVSLFEGPSCTAPRGTVQRARVPAVGTHALGPVTSIGTLRVVLVPISYGADGSNRLPDTSPEQVALFRSAMFSRYPLANLEVSVRAPVAWSQPVGRNGSGWTALVESIATLRQSDAAAPNTYYYGMFRPVERIDQFCPQCVLGLAMAIPPANDDFARAAIGLGFTGATFSETFVHEVGHILGRAHTPCGGPAGIDPSFPYAGGVVGAWGFDLMTRELKSPDAPDFMGYCEPTWISDYTYAALFERFRQVTLEGRAQVFAVPKVWRTIVVDVDSSLAWGSRVERRSEPSGTSVAAVLLDANGVSLGPIEARFAAMTHAAGGLIFLEEPTAGAAAVSIEGFGTLAL